MCISRRRNAWSLCSCMSTRSWAKCKHGFLKMLVARTTVICNGNSRRFNVRISGRRNALGVIVGRRIIAYASGTMQGVAYCVGSNTHTATNYRLPPCATTHDPECSNTYCAETMAQEQPAKRRPQLLWLSKTINRASREMSGYYMGYTYKGQPVEKNIEADGQVFRISATVFE